VEAERPRRYSIGWSMVFLDRESVVSSGTTFDSEWLLVARGKSFPPQAIIQLRLPILHPLRKQPKQSAMKKIWSYSFPLWTDWSAEIIYLSTLWEHHSFLSLKFPLVRISRTSPVEESKIFIAGWALEFIPRVGTMWQEALRTYQVLILLVGRGPSYRATSGRNCFFFYFHLKPKSSSPTWDVRDKYLVPINGFAFWIFSFVSPDTETRSRALNKKQKELGNLIQEGKSGISTRSFNWEKPETDKHFFVFVFWFLGVHSPCVQQLTHFKRKSLFSWILLAIQPTKIQPNLDPPRIPCKSESFEKWNRQWSRETGPSRIWKSDFNFEGCPGS